MGGAALYILWDYLKRTDARIDIRDKSFIKFANEHNDAMAELIRESTKVIKETGEVIGRHTEILSKIEDKIK
jgi:hypothetical protein